ncbi:Rho GTPase-activating protein 26, partial [Xenoophorus captivus]
GEEESFILKSCTRRKTESIEKRFCFDVEAVDRQGIITMQALSEEDRRLWMEAMDGREPVYNLNKDNQTEGMAQLDVTGFNVMKKFIYAVETRGIMLTVYLSGCCPALFMWFVLLLHISSGQLLVLGVQ